MTTLAVNCGLEYLFSRLHGLWEQSFQGARLERLLASGSVENLLSQLRKEGLQLNAGEDFSLALRRHRHALCEEIQRQVSPELRLYLTAVLDEDTTASLKLLLRRKFCSSQPQDFPPLKLGETILSAADSLALLEQTDAKEFVARLPQVFPPDQLQTIVEALADSHDLLAADSALDILASQRRLQAARALPLSCRRAALELVQFEIDLTNSVTALRNAAFHHLPASAMASCWLPGGARLSSEKLAVLCAFSDKRTCLAAFPASFRDLLLPFQDGELYLCEGALWDELQRKALLLFRDFGAPELSIVSFPYLLRFETTNLIRLHEGLRLGLSVAEIRKMLIGGLLSPSAK